MNPGGSPHSQLLSKIPRRKPRITWFDSVEYGAERILGIAGEKQRIVMFGELRHDIRVWRHRKKAVAEVSIIIIIGFYPRHFQKF